MELSGNKIQICVEAGKKIQALFMSEFLVYAIFESGGFFYLPKYERSGIIRIVL